MEANNNEMLREVVKELLDAMYDMGIDEETVSIAAESPNCHMHSVELLSVIKKAKAALAEPPRQCDVGTADEQSLRFGDYCLKSKSKDCWYCHNPPINLIRCCLRWAQMPYEKEANKNYEQ